MHAPHQVWNGHGRDELIGLVWHATVVAQSAWGSLGTQTDPLFDPQRVGSPCKYRPQEGYPPNLGNPGLASLQKLAEQPGGSIPWAPHRARDGRAGPRDLRNQRRLQ